MQSSSNKISMKHQNTVGISKYRRGWHLRGARKFAAGPPSKLVASGSPGLANGTGSAKPALCPAGLAGCFNRTVVKGEANIFDNL